MANSCSIQDVCSICASPKHVAFVCPSVIEQVNVSQVLQPTILTQILIILVGRIILTFLEGLKM